ncbi:MAG: hypothetical protein Q9224_002191 [Gallowayella concinna]
MAESPQDDREKISIVQDVQPYDGVRYQPDEFYAESGRLFSSEEEYLDVMFVSSRGEGANTRLYSDHKSLTTLTQLCAPDKFCYNLKYMELHGRHTNNPWSQRTMCIYQQHDRSTHQTKCIFLQPADRVYQAIQKDPWIHEKILPLHILCLSAAESNWGSYIEYMHLEIAREARFFMRNVRQEADLDQDEKACFCRVERPRRHDYQIGFSNLQKLQLVRRRLWKAVSSLESNLEVTEGCTKFYQDILTGSMGFCDDSYAGSVAHFASRFRGHHRRIHCLLNSIDSTSDLLSKALGFRHNQTLIAASGALQSSVEKLMTITAETNHESANLTAIARHGQKDSTSLKALSRIATLYLPATLIAPYFETPLLINFILTTNKNPHRFNVLHWSQPPPTPNTPLIPYDITTFLATALERDVDFVPIAWMPGLKPLGRGGTSWIRQSIVNLEASFALKQIQFPDTQNPDEADIIRAAIIELIVLTHPPIRSHLNVLNLEGVCWDASDTSRPTRPVLVLEKSELGDLGYFMSRLGDQVTPVNRVELCADIINAVAILHANGVIHGDVKPENLLMFQRANGEYYVKLCDLGFSSLFANQEDVKLDLPISHPWNAPELSKNGQFGLSVVEAQRSDIYSVGLVCLWLLFGKGVAVPPDNIWGGGYDFITELKQSGTINHFASSKLDLLPDVDEEMKCNLRTFFRLTTAEKSETRIPRLDKFVDNPGNRLERPVESSVPLFSANYTLRKQVVTCLRAQTAAKDHVQHQSHAAFQLAMCKSLGLGGLQEDGDITSLLSTANKTVEDLDTEIEKIRMRDTKDELKYRNPLFNGVFQEGSRHQRGDEVPAPDHKLVYDTEIGCSSELEVMERILLPGDVVIHGLRIQIVRELQFQGRYSQARYILAELLERLENNSDYGPTHHETLDIASYLMNMFQQEGDYQKALEIGQRILSTHEQELDSDDLRTVNAQKRIASVFTSLGSWDQAEKLLRGALDTERHVFGPSHPIYLATMNQLGVLLTTMDRNDEVSTVWTELLEKLTGALTIEHRLTLTVLGNTASWLDGLGEYFASEKMHRMCLALTEIRLGPRHPTVALLLSDLAIVVKNQDRYGEAEDYARKAFEMNQELLGPEHPQTLTSLNNLANIVGRLERYPEAESMLATVVAVYEKILGSSHHDTLSSKLNLANVLRDQRRLEEARTIQMEIVATCERVASEDRSLTIDARSQLGNTLHHLGDHDAAIREYRAVLAGRTALLGGGHPDTWSAMVNLAAVLHEDGQPETQWQEAEQLLQLAIQKNEGRFGERHTRTLSSTFWLAVLRVKMGQVENSATLFERAYLGFQETLGDENEWTRIALRCLNGF